MQPLGGQQVKTQTPRLLFCDLFGTKAEAKKRLLDAFNACGVEVTETAPDQLPSVLPTDLAGVLFCAGITPDAPDFSAPCFAPALRLAHAVYAANLPALYLGAAFELQLTSFLTFELNLTRLDPSRDAYKDPSVPRHRLLAPLPGRHGTETLVAEEATPLTLALDGLEVVLDGEGEIHPGLQGRLLKAKVRYLMSFQSDGRPALFQLRADGLNLGLVGMPTAGEATSQVLGAFARALHATDDREQE